MLLIGLGVGFAVGFLLAKSKTTGNIDTEHLAQQLQEEKLTNAKLTEAERRLTADKDRLIKEMSERDQIINQLNGRIEASLAKFEAQDNRMAEQKKEFEDLNKRFNTEFQNLANKILEEKSEKFTEKNKENLEAILKPLRERAQLWRREEGQGRTERRNKAADGIEPEDQLRGQQFGICFKRRLQKTRQLGRIDA